MGHWSEQLVGEAAAKIGRGIDEEALKSALMHAATEIEILSGRVFSASERRTETFETGGLPFAEIPDLRVGPTFESNVEAWPIPDPRDPDHSVVLQVGRFQAFDGRVMPLGHALWAAGMLVAQAKNDGLLSREYLLTWLGRTFDSKERPKFLRRLVDPTNRVYAPLIAAGGNGWWFQITRRLMWITAKTPDEPRLVEPLIDQEGELRALVGAEPVLILARTTNHPVDWAMSMRIWPDVARPHERPWRMLARAIHGHGLPLLVIDDASSSEEVACQVQLLARWHGYLGADDPGLADGIALAFPAAVQRIRRAVDVPDSRSAAAVFLEGLLHPGFDPARGAESIRKYVNRKASIVIQEYRKATTPGPREWERLGVSERYYYKLLHRFAPRSGSDYVVDACVLDRIHAYLSARDHRIDQRQAAMDLLLERGFTHAGARKWLQRHRLEEAVRAWPRSRAKRSSAKTAP